MPFPDEAALAFLATLSRLQSWSSEHLIRCCCWPTCHMAASSLVRCTWAMCLISLITSSLSEYYYSSL